jgi:hypothetical protein
MSWMFRIKSQKEWEDLVRRGLKGEVWALEIAAETALSAVNDANKLSREAAAFLSHLMWLAEECERMVSWITRPSCKDVREAYLRLGIRPERMDLPISDLILLRRMFNSVPALWAEEFI